MKLLLSKLIATCFGIGYLQKGAGTLAALFCCLVWWLLRIHQTSIVWQAAQIVAVFFVGVVVSSVVEEEWGHDNNRVVVDEWLGMSVGLFLLPFSWINYALAFVLFRFFDIVKPLFIKKAERLPKGWGVMVDDLIAGLYSAVILQAFIKIVHP